MYSDGEVRLDHKTVEQKMIIQTFFRPKKGGCLAFKPKEMTPEEYEALVSQWREKLALKQKGLLKLGIDEDQVKEIAPICFWGYNYDKPVYTRARYASKIQETWLFFSDTQIYVYSYTFSMTDAFHSEKTEEYFYKDVTSFSTFNDHTETVNYFEEGCPKREVGKKSQVDTAFFKIVVPGETFMCPIIVTQSNEQKIQAMKQKLREKKL